MSEDHLDAKVERQIITGMVISTPFLAKLQQFYRPEYLSNPYTRRVAQWCITHYKEHNEAPSEEIKHIYEEEQGNIPVDQSELIRKFLSSISEEYARDQKFNVDVVLSRAVRYFKKTHLSDAIEDAFIHIENGDVDEAERMLNALNKIDLPRFDDCSPTDPKEVVEAFENAETDKLFKFDGAIGELLNSELYRGGFISILAPEKRGKTWIMVEFAYRAAEQGCNVGFFTLGDLTKQQLLRRMHLRMSSRLTHYDPKYCVETELPVPDCEYNQKDTCSLGNRTCSVGVYTPDGEKMSLVEAGGYLPCTECVGCPANGHRYFGAVWRQKRGAVEPMDAQEAALNGVHFEEDHGDRMRLSYFPTDTANVKTLESQLDRWEEEGFSADVVIVDYIDIMSPEPNAPKEYRHLVNATWKSLRRMNQERNVLLIGATQADAASYSAETLTEQNFSETKTKHAHITMEIGLNQTPEEKRNHLLRINQIMVRENGFDRDKNVSIIQCIQVGRPLLASF